LIWSFGLKFGFNEVRRKRTFFVLMKAMQQRRTTKQLWAPVVISLLVLAGLTRDAEGIFQGQFWDGNSHQLRVFGEQSLI
jgi:hypothetical protein